MVPATTMPQPPHAPLAPPAARPRVEERDGGHAGDPARDPLAAGLRALFALHVDGVLALDAGDAVVDANPAALALVGEEEAATLAGRPLLALLAEEDRTRGVERLAAARAGAVQRWEADLLPADLGRRRVLLTAVPVAADDATPDGTPNAGLMIVAQDVTAVRALEQQLAHRAFHDPLTGLANRALFRDRTEQALLRDPTGAHVAVIFVDLDDFKQVNDSLGHAAGDELLVKVAALLVESTRGSDIVARFGGDEFAVLLSRVAHPEHVAAVAARIAVALRRPMALRGRTVMVGASLGIAHGAAGLTADDLLRDADQAMYRAKVSGKGDAAGYHAAGHADAVDRAELLEELRAALAGEPAGGRLSLAYQPVVELRSGRVTAYEALARWWTPRRGEVPTALLVALAEESGLIVALGRWVLTTACAQLRRWSDLHPTLHASVRVNLSRQELEHPTLLRDVADALDAAGIAPGRLTLELSEGSVMRRPDESLVTLHGLRELGVRLAIDDFGTAASSLGHLQRFPVDELKIDREIVRGVPEDANASALVRSLVALGRALRLEIVAEGVERPVQRAMLADLGCEMAQGYLFARPGEPEAHPPTVPDAPPA